MSQNQTDFEKDFDGSTLFEYWFKHSSAWFNEIKSVFETKPNKVKNLFADTRLGEQDGEVVTLNIKGTARLVDNGMISFNTPSDDDNDGIGGPNADDVNIGGSGPGDLDNENDNEDDDEFSSDKPVLVAGGRGKDTLKGSDNDDILASNRGDDKVYAGGGNDFVKGGHGNDHIYGGNGNDLLNGDYSDSDKHNKRGGGKDLLKGGQGDDIVYGNQNDDTVYGDGGDDILIGGNDDDEIYGGEGKDFIFGDLLKGSSVQDLRDHLGAGNAKLNGDVTDSGGHVRMGDDWIDAGAGDDVVDGDGGNDTIFGRSGDDDLDGDGGHDVIVGGTGNDSVFGDAGNDSLEGGSGSDKLYGGSGNDSIRGDVIDDEFGGGVGVDINDPLNDADDIIDAGSGNDTIDGGAGLNIITTGDGKNEFDTVIVNATGYDEFTDEPAQAPNGLFEHVITDFDAIDDDPTSAGGDWDTLKLTNLNTDEDGFGYAEGKKFDEAFLNRLAELEAKLDVTLSEDDLDASDGNLSISSFQGFQVIAYALESDGNSTTDAYIVGENDLVLDLGDLRHVVLQDVFNDDFTAEMFLDQQALEDNLFGSEDVFGSSIEVDELNNYAEFKAEEPYSSLTDALFA